MSETTKALRLACSSSTAEGPLADTQQLQTWSEKWKRNATSVVRQVRTLTLVLAHREVPWSARAAAACAIAYLFSPIQLIPTFIPVIGQMDDLAVLYIGMKIVCARTPSEILAECEARARGAIDSHNAPARCDDVPIGGRTRKRGGVIAATRQRIFHFQ